MTSTPLREIKPVVVPAQYFVFGPLIAGFFSIFPGFFTFVISNMISMSSRNFSDGPNVNLGLIVFFISFAVGMYLLYIKCFQEPGRTTYTIFSDRIEYDEGLFNRHRRTVVFDQVIDVSLTEGMLQQTRKAGTVTLVTQQLVSGQDGRLSNRQIALRNVPEPRDVYDLIRSLAMKKSGP